MNESLQFIMNKYQFDLSNGPRFNIDSGRGDLPILWQELGYKKGAEIGVESGRYSQYICAKNPGLKLYLVDAWEPYAGYREHVSKEHMDILYKDTIRRTSLFDCEIMRGYSMDVVKNFEDESLDFVYIDANHDFENVTNDITEWSKKVRVGGIISGHDYRRTKVGARNDTVEAVNAYIESHAISPWFVYAADSAPSWMWVKS